MSLTLWLIIFAVPLAWAALGALATLYALLAHVGELLLQAAGATRREMQRQFARR